MSFAASRFAWDTSCAAACFALSMSFAAASGDLAWSQPDTSAMVIKPIIERTGSRIQNLHRRERALSKLLQPLCQRRRVAITRSHWLKSALFSTAEGENLL